MSEEYPENWKHCMIHLNPETGEMHSDGDHSVRHWIEEKMREKPDGTGKPTRRGVISQLAYWNGGHNASETSWGRLGMQVNVEDDAAVAEYFYKSITEDARKPLLDEITRLKAMLFDLQNAQVMPREASASTPCSIS